MSAVAATVRVPSPPLWRRLLGFNLLAGIVLGIVGWIVGNAIGNGIDAKSIEYYTNTAGQSDIAVLLGYFLGVAGFLIGLGFANYPLKRMLGHPPTLAEHESEGEGIRWWASSTWSGLACSSSSVG